MDCLLGQLILRYCDNCSDVFEVILVSNFLLMMKFITRFVCFLCQVLQHLKDKALKRSGLTEEGILHLIEERAMARKNKDFNRGDEIRSELAVKGIALMDVGKETIWRPCVPPEQPSLPVQKEQPSVPDKQEEQVLPVST